MKNSVWIGFDPREAAEFAVARQSVEQHSLKHWPICGLVLSKLRAAGLYTRPMEIKQGVDGPEMWDVISGARQATEHANSRFLVPHLAEEGWALFMDGDTMVCSSLMPLFASLDYGKALYCVHHKHEPTTQTKMDGQVQQNYGRKNWSASLFLIATIRRTRS
jgi:lipopolysaccharide biosynthesis glycosyltransferase